MSQIQKQIEALDYSDKAGYKKHLEDLLKKTGNKNDIARYRNVIILINKSSV